MVACLFVMSVRVGTFPFEVVALLCLVFIKVIALLVIYFNHCSAFNFRALLGSAEAPWEEGGSEADR